MEISYNQRFNPQLMYLSPRDAFLAAASLIFLSDYKADSLLTAIMTSRGHISANIASLVSPFHALINSKLSIFKLSVLSSKIILSNCRPIFYTSFLFTSKSI